MTLRHIWYRKQIRNRWNIQHVLEGIIHSLRSHKRYDRHRLRRLHTAIAEATEKVRSSL